jgi:hypothetical protein
MVYAMCSVHALITSAVVHMGQDEDVTEESLTFKFHAMVLSPLSLGSRISAKQDPEGAPDVSKALSVSTLSLHASHGGD